MCMSTKNSETKNCVDCKSEFTIDSGDLILYKKVGLNIPDECFECGHKHRFAFSIFGKFRKGISALSGESLITVSLIMPDSLFIKQVNGGVMLGIR